MYKMPLSEDPTIAELESSSLPDIRRPDSTLVLASEWQVGSAERQRLAVDLAVAAWRRIPWPAGLLSISWFISLDGEAVVTYSQWAGVEFADAFARGDGPTVFRDLLPEIPGLTLAPPTRYRLYRSGTREDAPVPGCVVFVSVEFDGPDAARQRSWVELVFEALAGTPPPPGGISGHFHVSLDGTQVLNYAEWVDADAHTKALEESGGTAIGDGVKWRAVQTYRGIIRSGFRRCTLARSLQRPEGQVDV